MSLLQRVPSRSLAAALAALVLLGAIAPVAHVSLAEHHRPDAPAAEALGPGHHHGHAHHHHHGHAERALPDRDDRPARGPHSAAEHDLTLAFARRARIEAPVAAPIGIAPPAGDDAALSPGARRPAHRLRATSPPDRLARSRLRSRAPPRR